MQIRSVIASFCFLACGARADQIFSCAVPGDAGVSGPTPCSLAGNYSSVAVASGGLTLPGTTTPLSSLTALALTGPTSSATTSFSASVSAFARAWPGYNGTYYNASAASNISWTGTFFTSGPVRQGWILLDLTAGGASEDGLASASASVDSYSASFFQTSCHGCVDALLPFTLGQAFSVSLSDNARIFANAQDLGDASAAASLSFSLFEADGITPVDIGSAASTPEPGTFAQLLAAACFMVWRKIRPAASRCN